MNLSRFFIDRPVFAWVIAVVIMLAGGIAAFSLPIEQYPTIAPPSVVISATYPGADSESLQNSVTQVIEQQLTGLDNLLYFSSSSNADGTVTRQQFAGNQVPKTLFSSTSLQALSVFQSSGTPPGGSGCLGCMSGIFCPNSCPSESRSDCCALSKIINKKGSSRFLVGEF